MKLNAKMSVSVMSIAILLNACSAKKSEGAKDAASADAASEAAVADVSEHCLDDKASACFIQKDGADGRSHFYTTDSYNKTWLVNQGIVDTSIQMEVISDSEYQNHMSQTVAPRMTYGKDVQVQLDVVDENGQPKVLPGRDANARLPIGALAKNAGIFKKFGGILKGGKGAGGIATKLKGFLGKGGKSSGVFGKLLGGGKKSGGGVFKKIAIALGLGFLVGAGSGSPDAAANARVTALGANIDVPMNITLGADSVQEDVTME